MQIKINANKIKKKKQTFKLYRYKKKNIGVRWESKLIPSPQSYIRASSQAKIHVNTWQNLRQHSSAGLVVFEDQFP